MKTAKTIFVLALMLTLFCVPALALSLGVNSISDESNIRVTLLSQTPTPVAPGRYVELRFRVENLGTSSIDNLVFELIPTYPFSLDPGDSGQVRVGSFYGKATGEEGATIYYKVRVDPDALEGLNNVRLRYSLDGGESWTTNEFSISVQAASTQIGITSVTSTPSTLEPGKTARVVLQMSNTGLSYIQDVAVKLDLSSSTLPFAPVNSTTEKKISTIAAKSSADFVFDLVTTGNADSSIYKVPIDITYSDSSGESHTKSDYISLTVGTAPDIEVLLDSQEVYSAGAAGIVSIKFVNKGVTNAKFLNVVLEPNDKFEIIGENTVYLGKLDSDDFESADFKIYVKPTKDKTISLPIVLEYTDANNQEYQQRVNIPLRMYSSAELKKFGFSNGGGGAWFLIIILLLAGGGYYLYKRKKAKAHHK